MPKYYFHLHNDIEARDDEGQELPHLEGATMYAKMCARFAMAESVKDHGSIDLKHRIDVEDSEGAVLATVRFGDVLRIIP